MLVAMLSTYELSSWYAAKCNHFTKMTGLLCKDCPSHFWIPQAGLIWMYWSANKIKSADRLWETHCYPRLAWLYQWCYVFWSRVHNQNGRDGLYSLSYLISPWPGKPNSSRRRWHINARNIKWKKGVSGPVIYGCSAFLKCLHTKEHRPQPGCHYSPIGRWSVIINWSTPPHSLVAFAKPPHSPGINEHFLY